MRSDHHREKKRKQKEARKQRILERGSEERTDSADGLFRRASRATFGDVVQRPPIMSGDVLKSQAKLRAAAAGSPNEVPDGVPDDMRDYASKVRAAYAEIKRRRLAKGGR
mmetsp:Transcript_117929/g.217015  ORF Transcript_117929/g.217015 Transcript_117929/m.217015 type:complete len:110 (+) Transcript_117929:1-330(+)